MAFLRYASAVVIHPRTTQQGWSRVRTAAKAPMAPSRNLIGQATEILGESFDPEKYLLTHATIVASVDVEKVSNVRLGSVTEDGRKINRKYADYYVSPDTTKYVNNNGDCWGREVLLKSYRTFIGGHNFQEHVQIEEMSKGRIIDAVARDIGDSLYIDILVATDRKHADLVAAIESGDLTTLSMGCSVDETTCTKCGNVAIDETELCNCIKYSKLNAFLDPNGKRRVVAELCGHISLEPTAGVTFIEASWVASPAFTGAVMRNILTPKEMSPAMLRKAQEILSQPPAEWVAPDGRAKAAFIVTDGSPVPRATITPSSRPTEQGSVVGKVTRRAEFDFGDGGGDEGGDAAPAPEEKAPPASPLKNLEEDVMSEIVDRVHKRVRDELKGKPNNESTMAPNDNVVKEAADKAAASYRTAVQKIVRVAGSDIDLINKIATLDDSLGVKAPIFLYRIALCVGPSHHFPSLSRFLAACKNVTEQTLNISDARTLVRLGRLLSAREKLNSTHTGVNHGRYS